MPPDSQQREFFSFSAYAGFYRHYSAATRRIALKEVGTDLVANLNLLNRFSRSLLDLMSWWEWLEEELLSPNSTLLPSMKDRDADLYARWSRIKAGYLDYYNTVRDFRRSSSSRSNDVISRSALSIHVIPSC